MSPTCPISDILSYTGTPQPPRPRCPPLLREARFLVATAEPQLRVGLILMETRGEERGGGRAAGSPWDVKIVVSD